MEKALDEQVPGWQALVKDPAHWPMLDEAKPGGKYADDLYELFIETAGAALAKRWFDANDDEKRRAARNWLCNLHHLSPELWQDLDEPTKQHIFKEMIPNPRIGRHLYDAIQEWHERVLHNRITLKQWQWILKAAGDRLFLDRLRQLEFEITQTIIESVKGCNLFTSNFLSIRAAL